MVDHISEANLKLINRQELYFSINSCFLYDLNTKMKKDIKDLTGVSNEIFEAHPEFFNTLDRT